MSELLMKTVTSLLLFSLIIMGFVVVLGEGSSTYSFTPSNDFNSTFSVVNRTVEETTNLTRDATDQMFSTEEETNLDVINSLISGAFSSLKIVWRSFDLAKTLIIAVGATLGIPAWVIGIFTTILLSIIMFSVLFIILQSR